MSGKYRKLQVFWGVLFVLSLLFIFTGLGSRLLEGIGESDGLDKPTVDPGEPDQPGQQQGESFNLGMVLAVITTVASGAGFVATTYFAIRDDRRQTEVHQLQIQSLKKEIEHKDLEITRLRQEQEAKPPPEN